jgi:hypothetical protein
MGRKPPARVRAATLHPRLDKPVAMLPGISPRGVAAIVQLERTRLRPGAAHEVLKAWTLLLRDPYHRRFDLQHGCGELLCCPDPVEVRGILETVARSLPTKDARAFRRRLAILDDQW